MEIPVLLTFILYFLLLLGIGLYFYKGSKSIEEYLLGGRGMGAWVTAFSAQASDMSGWLLMGLPGAIYLAGISQAWIAVGLFIGTCLNWLFVAPRLRIYTKRVEAITLPCFFQQRFRDPTGLLRTVSAVIILIFFTTYSSSGLVATGKLFESTFGISYRLSVIVGGSIIIFYTFLGGFKAVCWTDLLQGSLMIIAIVAVPSWGYLKNFSLQTNVLSHIFDRGFIPSGSSMPLLAVGSAMAWGLGYFGQPHILVRFMSAKSLSILHRSTSIAIIWVAISLVGAVWIGLIGIVMFDNLSGGEEEKVFIYMIQAVCSPWIAGIMLAAILSAIMSTIDSQLLVSSSALAEDFYQKVIKRTASEKEVLLVGRLCVLIISLIALLLALNPVDTILKIVAYAWGGLGAAFGPAILASLFSRTTTWYSALFGMIAGTIVLIVWKQFGLDAALYEIVPGFAANTLILFLFNWFSPQKDQKIITEFNQVRRQLHQRNV